MMKFLGSVAKFCFAAFFTILTFYAIIYIGFFWALSQGVK